MDMMKRMMPGVIMSGVFKQKKNIFKLYVNLNHKMLNVVNKILKI